MRNGRMIEVERATDPITSATTFATNGRLPPEAATEFVKMGVDQSGDIWPLIDVVPMQSHTKYIDRIDVGSRLLYAAGEGTTPSAKATPTPARRQLIVAKTGLAFDYTAEALDDNIEGDGLVNTLLGEYSRQWMDDHLDLAINGDGATPGFLSLNKGWVTLAKESAVAGTGVVRVNTDGATKYSDAGGVFELMLAQIAAKYRTRMGAMGWRFLVSVATADKYAKELRALGTILGDNVLVNGASGIPFNGIPVTSTGYLVDASATKPLILLCPPKNLKWGYLKSEMRLNTWYNQDLDQGEVRIFARTDAEFAIPDQIIVGYDY